MRLNAWIYKRWRAPRAGVVRVHLGPGQRNYLKGWINVDANMFTGKCDVWANLEDGLPFRDQTVDAIYSHHVIEHLSNLDFHFKEMFRILKRGGVFRVGGPNGDAAIRKYLEQDTAWFSDFPVSRHSIGGRLENFIFCRGEHLTILTPSFLNELAVQAGFGEVSVAEPCRTTRYPQHFGEAVLRLEWESTPDTPHTLIVEGCKP
ncbi:MAG: class I SAM-dependent methyltransferase [Verrucomicrobiae bacterium]|nr:class I SAM-dependent methyltransferase [Verrucomicrobiae bacterium]